MKRIGLILGLAAIVGCGGVQEASDPNQRGDVDAGGAGGSVGSMGGAPGAGGGTVTSAGGANGAGAAPADGGGAGAMGGMAGAGGALSYASCSTYDWRPASGGGCTKQVSPGVYQTGFKDGHTCGVCSSPVRPGGVPDCLFGSGNSICVVSCSECTFQ